MIRIYIYTHTYTCVFMYAMSSALCDMYPDMWWDWVRTDKALRPGQCLVQCSIPQLQLASACRRHLCVPILRNLVCSFFSEK